MCRGNENSIKLIVKDFCETQSSHKMSGPWTQASTSSRLNTGFIKHLMNLFAKHSFLKLNLKF